MIKITLTLLLLCATLKAATIQFDPFETGGITNPSDLNNINITAEFTENQGNLEISLFNNSTFGDPSITQIGFDDEFNLISSQPNIINFPPNVEFSIKNSLNISGSNNILFDTKYGFVADPPPVTNGIDIGEYIQIIINDLTEEEFRNGIEKQQIRIAFHIQSIGSNKESAGYVNRRTIVPEPTVILLAIMALTLGLIKRRSQSKNLA